MIHYPALSRPSISIRNSFSFCLTFFNIVSKPIEHCNTAIDVNEEAFNSAYCIASS